MKPPKWFVHHIAAGDGGIMLGRVVLTPPMDTEAEANDYRNWYYADSNPLRAIVTAQFVAVNKTAKHISHAYVAFETTLY